MSTDYEIGCMKCKVYMHFGQHMACIFSTGFGSNDKSGNKVVGDFILDHVSHDLRLKLTDSLDDAGMFPVDFVYVDYVDLGGGKTSST